ncbi:hypothetical protein ACFUCV_04735 [Specibacter sp. NPDC057265]|uniref:hypothetical protein n=1 Tax=Specibacter sp. NPDC057265 TaxID=3346075 RepID=UPI003626238E
MEYLVPLVIVLVIVLIVWMGSRFLGRRSHHEDGTAAPAAAVGPTQGAGKAGSGMDITRADAERASARLDPETHRRIYSLIAQRQVFNAVKEYRQATRTGLREATASVAALAQFPQPAPERKVEKQADVKPQSTQAKAGVAPQSAQPAAEAPLTVEDILAAGSVPEAAQAAPPVAAAGSYRYRAIVSRGDDVREVASTRLNADIYTRIRQLAQSGNYDAAASLLRDHADIGVEDAREFVSMIGPED